MSITLNLVVNTNKDMQIPYFSKKQILSTYENLY